MYITSVDIKDIKGLLNVQLSFGEGDLAGWNVILGDNSAGKTTLIRAIALALVGPLDAQALREDWTRWVKHQGSTGSIKINYSFDSDWDTAAAPGNLPQKKVSHVNFLIEKTNIEGNLDEQGKQAKISGQSGHDRLLWSSNRGFFSASFGPARRFSGGSGDYQRIFYSTPNVARHLSAFTEEVALSEALEWLVDKKRYRKNNDINKIIKFINDYSLMPHGVQLDKVNDKTLYFRDGNGVVIDAKELSDGYRSILSLTLELLRQMEVSYGLDKMFDRRSGVVDVPGVVLVDEIDAHLHPSWQETVGQWFTTRFPKIQFIVATHSPLVCRSIGPTGKVYRLRTPGTEGNQVQEVTGEDRDILWYGSLERALESPAFQLNIGRSEYGWERIEEMRALSKAAREGIITREGRARLQHLRAVLADAGEED